MFAFLRKEPLSFPGLGLEFELDRVAFAIGGIEIYWYGIIISIGCLLGALFLMKKAKLFGLDSDRVIDVLMGALILGIIGARTYFVIFSWDTFKDDILRVFNTRTGGMAIYGGVIGGILGGALMCKIRKVKFVPMLDLGLCGLMLGQAIGRWGNFVNVEAFGSNTTVPWGMTSPTIQSYLEYSKDNLAALGVVVDPQMPVHPTFFYESLWCLLGFAVMCFFINRRRFDGELSLIYLGWYGLGRFFIEGLRTDSLLIGSTVRVSQILALLCLIASVTFLVLIHSKIKRSGDNEFLQLYVNTEEGKAVVNGTFYSKKDDTDKEVNQVDNIQENSADIKEINSEELNGTAEDEQKDKSVDD